MRRIIAIACTAVALVAGSVAVSEASAPAATSTQACAFCWPTR